MKAYDVEHPTEQDRGKGVGFDRIRRIQLRGILQEIQIHGIRLSVQKRQIELSIYNNERRIQNEMNFREYLNSTFNDEVEAKDKYEDMINVLKKDTSIEENIKALILGIIFKIQTDEKTHKILLSIIKEVLDN